MTLNMLPNDVRIDSDVFVILNVVEVGLRLKLTKDSRGLAMPRNVI